MDSAFVSKTTTVEMENVFTRVSTGTGAFGVCEWRPAVCSEGCAEAGGLVMEDDVCWKQNACMRWCDEPSMLVVLVAETIEAGSNMVIEIEFMNPSIEQAVSTVTVSGMGPGLFIKPTEAATGVLQARESPKFLEFTLDESQCAETQGVAPILTSGEWIADGQCAGQRNAVTFAITPNLALEPGARITITGLNTGSLFQKAPTVVTEDGMFDSLGIVSWSASCSSPSSANAVSCGTVILQVLPNSGSLLDITEPSYKVCVDSAAIPANQQTKFMLAFDMPLLGTAHLGSEPSISASHHNGMAECALSSKKALTKVLANAVPETRSFVVKNIKESTCLPGRCNTISVEFAVNDVLPKDSIIALTSLISMDKATSCYTTGVCDALDTQALPLEDDTSTPKDLFKSPHRRHAGEATWDKDTYSLRLMTTRDLHPYTMYKVSFKLKNGFPAANVIFADLVTAGASVSGIKILAYVTTGADAGKCWKSAAASTADAAGETCNGEAMVLASPSDDSATRMAVCAPALEVDPHIANTWPGCGGPDTHAEVSETSIRLTPYTPSEEAELKAQQRKLSNAKNTLTLTLRSNVDIPASTPMTIAGLTHATDVAFKNSTWAGLMIANYTYDDEDFVASFALTKALDADVALVLELELINPIAQQDGQAASVHASFQLSEGVYEGTETSLLNLETSIPASAGIMKVDKPKWVIASIGQSTPDPYEENMISVTLKANIEIRAGAKITLQGLDGYGTTSTESLQLTTSMLEAYGKFQQEEGLLTLTVKDKIAADTLITVSFVLKNPCSEQTNNVFVQLHDTPFDFHPDCNCPPATETITTPVTSLDNYWVDCNGTEHTSDPGHGCHNVREVTTNSITEKVVPGNCTCKYKSSGNDCPLDISPVTTPLGPLPLSVNAPKFLKHVAAQTSCHPGSSNTISVTFQMNVMLLSDSKVYISGFAGVPKSVSISPTSGSATWDPVRRLVTITYDTLVVAGYEQTLTMNFVNPSLAQRTPELSIWTANICECAKGLPQTSVDKPEDECSQPLTIAPPAFCDPCIQQSHPYVGASNTITATICTNIPLKRPHKAKSCPAF